jgi:hypothetical protein
VEIPVFMSLKKYWKIIQPHLEPNLSHTSYQIYTEHNIERLIINEPRQGPHIGPVDRAFYYKLPVLYEVFYLLFKCQCFYACVHILFCNNYVQLTRSFKRKSCYASPLKNKYQAAIVRCQICRREP